MAGPSARNSSLLSPMHAYDDDAVSLHSDTVSLHSDQEHDSNDDEVLDRARNSTEVREYDRGVLLEDESTTEMAQKGLRRKTSFKSLKRKSSFSKATSGGIEAVKGIFGKVLGEREKPTDKRDNRRERRRRKRSALAAEAAEGEDAHLMYELEQGRLKDGSDTGDSSETDASSDINRLGLHKLDDKWHASQRDWMKRLFIYLLIALLFAILFMGSWRLSLGRKTTSFQYFNNGTAFFAPTTILISLDGFRADFLQRGITPRLNKFIAEGISPKYMHPSFPSVTFPNHYTLATGMYPEAHGVVGNTFWDPDLKQEFFYIDTANSMQGKWWGGEPIWVTAEQQGIRTAVHMWPGSEANIMNQSISFLDDFNSHEPLPNKVARILELIDMPGMEAGKNFPIASMRPQLIAAYVPDVDAMGHKAGPNSTEIFTTIREADNMLDQLFAGLEERNLTDVVNVIVVSDHGMASTSNDRLIQLDDIIDMDKIEHTDGWPLYGLRPKNDADLRSLYDVLLKESKANPNFEVYLRDENMPERWHFSKNERIAPLWVIPKTGWAIVKKSEFNIEEEKVKGGVYHPRGLHGYDNEHPLMRAIFIARGPAFPHAPNSRVEPFQNIEVYNIVCDSLGLQPNANNGTLRLPLRPIGLHDEENDIALPLDLPSTTVLDTTNSISTPNASQVMPAVISTAANAEGMPTHIIATGPVNSVAAAVEAANAASTPEEDHDAAVEQMETLEQEIEAEKSWWSSFMDSLGEIKNWVNGVVQDAGQAINKAGTLVNGAKKEAG